MLRVSLLFLIIFIAPGCGDRMPQTPAEEKATDSLANRQRAKVKVFISHGPTWKIGDSDVPDNIFDSVLRQEIRKAKGLVDSPTVIIHTDTTVLYSDVWRVVRIGKEEMAKIVATVTTKSKE
jgi:biopolymer transport protein ExbD